MAALALVALFGASACCSLTVRVGDEKGRALAAASVRISERSRSTDATGNAEFDFELPGTYTIEASAPGFQTLRKSVDLAAGRVEMQLLLPRATVESVTVEGHADNDASSATAAPTAPQQLKQLPTDPASVRDALPLVPGVVRTPEGRLSISGAPEYRSTLLVDSLDVTDPSTGRFGATVPIESVAALNVYKSPFLAEYGRFSAAVVAVETKRGGDKWHGEVNDPTPELRIRSRHVRGVRGFTPRVSFTGPLVRNRLYLAQSAEYRLNKVPVFTLPFPENETWRESWNSFTQLDYIPSARHVITATVHGVPQKVAFANLSFYTPRTAAPSFRGREFHTGFIDRLTIGGGVLESAFGAGEVTARTWAQGGDPMVLMPATTLGNYFLLQDRRARRYQWFESYSTTRGGHVWKAGVSAIRTLGSGWLEASQVSLADASRIGFQNVPGYRLSDRELGAYLQDHWQVRPRLGVDAGVRVDSQRAGGTRAAPRVAVSWSPFGDSGTVVRSGFGWFYDRVPLAAAAFPSYPQRIEGAILQNIVLGPLKPESRTWSMQVEHRLGRLVGVRANYLETHSRRTLTVDRRAGAVAVSAAGRFVYRQFEVVSRLSPREGQQLFFAYTRSLARSNLNDVSDYLGDFPGPVLRPDTFAVAPADTPHRFLLWGVIPLDSRTRFAPVVEYRSGLPYSPLDIAQQYAGTPNSRRFPNFFSLDYRLGRDIHVRGHAVQISFSMFNTTNHWNPDTVRWNIADPQFGEFLGQHRRRYRLDFDFLF